MTIFKGILSTYSGTKPSSRELFPHGEELVRFAIDEDACLLREEDAGCFIELKTALRSTAIASGEQRWFRLDAILSLNKVDIPVKYDGTAGVGLELNLNCAYVVKDQEETITCGMIFIPKENTT